jgi:hypothetical protein
MPMSMVDFGLAEDSWAIRIGGQEPRSGHSAMCKQPAAARKRKNEHLTYYRSVTIGNRILTTVGSSRLFLGPRHSFEFQDSVRVSPKGEVCQGY